MEEIKLIACKTIENELHYSMKQTGCQYEICWFESGLHNYPKKLHRRLQETLDSCGDCETVLLAMGFCGNSIVGLKTGKSRLIIPKVDDCISLLLGSSANRQALSAHDTYFMTEGWLKGERNIWKEYEYTMEKYGEETGKEIFDMMFQNYHALGMVDTGCYDMSYARKEAERICKKLNLTYRELPGTTSYLQELLTGPWTKERFIIVPPHTQLKLDKVTLPS